MFGKDPFGLEKNDRDSRRAFTRTQKNQILYQQDYKCAICHEKLDPRAIEFDHQKPWAAGGRTITVNGRALCANCHKIVTHSTRLKKVDKKTKKSAEKLSPFEKADKDLSSKFQKADKKLKKLFKL